MPPSVCSPWMMIESCWLRDTSRSSQDLTLKKYLDISWRLGDQWWPTNLQFSGSSKNILLMKVIIHKMSSARAERRRWPGSWPTERPQACPPKYIWGVSFARDCITWLEIHRQDVPIWSNIYVSLSWWIWSEVCEFSRMQASALPCGAPQQFRGCILCQDAMVPFPRSSPGHPNHDVRSQPGYQLPSENATQLCRTSGSGMDLKVYAKSPTVLKAQIKQTFSALLQCEPFCV